MAKINWRYAFGEIFIVMVGLSLAFGLNNLRDQYKNEEQTQHVDALQNDINEEIKHLTALDSLIQLKIEAIQKSRVHFGRNLPGRDTIVSTFFFVARNVTFLPKNTTYQTLINSGDMKLIADFELRKSIEAHYSSHKVLLKNYDRLDNIYAKYLGDFFIRGIDYAKMRTGNFDFMDNPLIGSIFNSLEASYRIALQANQECLKSNEELLKMLLE